MPPSDVDRMVQALVRLCGACALVIGVGLVAWWLGSLVEQHPASLSLGSGLVIAGALLQRR